MRTKMWYNRGPKANTQKKKPSFTPHLPHVWGHAEWAVPVFELREGGVGMVQKVNRDHGTIVMKGNRSRTHKHSVKHLLHRSRKWASFVHSFIINVRQWIVNWFEIIDNCRYTKIALVVWAGDVASHSQWRGRWWWHFPSLLAFTRHQLLTNKGPGHYAAKYGENKKQTKCAILWFLWNKMYNKYVKLCEGAVWSVINRKYH